MKTIVDYEDIDVATKLNRKGITIICKILDILCKCLVLAVICFYIIGIIYSFQFLIDCFSKINM